MRYGILDTPATGNLEEKEGKKETRKESDSSPRSEAGIMMTSAKTLLARSPLHFNLDE